MKDSRVEGRHERAPQAIAGVVLASGMSQRFGETNKLLLPVGGVPLVRRTAETYLAASLDPVIVVVGHDAERVRAALSGLPVVTVDNPEYRRGQSRALVRGVTSLPKGIVAAVLGVADQPALHQRVIARLIERFEHSGAPAVAPRYAGRRGNPVLFARELFPDLAGVTGDEGGRAVLARLGARVDSVDFADAEPGMDIDTAEDWTGWKLQERRE